MTTYAKNILLFFVLILAIPVYSFSGSIHQTESNIIEPAQNVLLRTIGEKANEIKLIVLPEEKGREQFKVEAINGKLIIYGSSSVALCYAFNTYLKEACHSMITWSGKNLHMPASWPDYSIPLTSTPYQFRYYLNVVTFGYTTPYWDWKRWEKELDWMALHGINMPLATVASESIAERVWLKSGLKKEDIRAFFTGPAHLPWHRMGNLNAWDGPLTDSWQNQQIELQHLIINRMRELGMHPIAPAFAGFVPEAFMKKHPELETKRLTWGGFPDQNNAFVLAPDSPFFIEIGKVFIQEWEKEFGKNTYYLSDSFNEMELPVTDENTKLTLLQKYGETIYKSIIAGNPNAIWVTQGWTFGYQHQFWNKASLQALLKNVPDNGIIIIDLANDYPKWIWHTDLTWKTHEGFYGKNWIYSFTPNFGGKTPLTGELNMYASYPTQALKSNYSSNLVGFGFAPEGIENNEVIYELLADIGWTNREIDLEKWLSVYANARYGSYPENVKQAWILLRKSVYNSLYSYTRFLWQTVVPDTRRVSRLDSSNDFMTAVELFLSAHKQLKGSELYQNDVIEFSALYLSAIADKHYKNALAADSANQHKKADAELKITTEILLSVDKLLASHPAYQLSNWINLARNQGTTLKEKNNYEANAKRLITTWGGHQNDYSARLWSGLIKDYYIPRITLHLKNKSVELRDWEEQWIQTPWKTSTISYSHPINEALYLVNKWKLNK